MKRNILCAALILAAGSVLAADKDDVSAAIAKLAASDNYSWHISTTNIPDPNAPAGGPGGPGGFGGRGRGRGNQASDGKAQKDGLMYVTRQGRGGLTEAYVKGGKGALKTADADWTSLDDAAADQGFAAMFANQLKAQKSAANDAKDWLDKTTSLAKTDDGYKGTLTADAIKSTVMTFPGQDPPEIMNPSGTATFWIKDGVLVKYERHTIYKRTFDFGDTPTTNTINQITTTEIKDIGATKIDVPDDAKKKM